MPAIVECVPNFSEGREESVLLALEEAIVSVPGIVLLGRESDADHNRSVFTFAGDPAAVEEAAVRAVGVAAARIDLNTHHGEHPRIGAADVVPFVPVRGISLMECAAIAHRAGEQIWQRFGVPVYFYEAAAKRPDRVRLENIRRGQFEGLRAELNESADRAPDLGHGRLHPTAGASVVGARKFLIAYNVNLKTPRLDIARDIARAIRASNGGLPCVKAMGMMLHSRGVAQVSINLTDYETTPLYKVFEAVAREATARGVEILGSELIGFVPRGAVEQTFAEALRFERFRPESVLENTLDAKLRM